MALVSKQGPGAGPEGDPGAQPKGPPPAPRHNLPIRTAPVVGRRTEMQQIAEAVEKARRAGRPGRVEIVGRPGIGTTSVAVELARRAGSRMPGGAWVLDASLGADLAWADVGAAKGRPTITNLAASAREEKERLAEGPQSVLVIDGVASGDDLLATMPLESRTPPFVFVTCAEKTGITDDVVEVADVPPQAARRICEAMLSTIPKQNGAEIPPAPPVRSTDGLGISASLSARVALALGGQAGPLLIQDVDNAVARLVPLIARSPACLEILLLASVVHPSRIAVDAILSAMTAVRRDRGPAPSPEEVGQAVLVLARAGLVDPLDDRRVAIHPLVQTVVRGMAKSEEDLKVAREAMGEGFAAEAEHSTTPEGIHVATCGLHQLRFLEPALTGEAQDKVRDARKKLETALGVA